MTKRKAPLAIADADGHVWTRAQPLADSLAVLDGVHRHRDGYLMADARVARVGVQTYRGYEVGMPDKDRVVLYRPEEEVFATDSMRSHANKPVTLTHPKNMVDAKTWKAVARGMSGSDVVRDGDFVRVPLMLTDAATINAFESGEARELSVGYLCDIDWTEGVTPQGQRFDGIQRDIRTNHHALVPVARGGANLRLGDAMRTYCADCGTMIKDGATSCQDCGGSKFRPVDDDDEAMMDSSAQRRTSAGEMLPSDRQTDAADGGISRSVTMPVVTTMFDGVPINFADEVSSAAIKKEHQRLVRIIDEMTAAAAKKKSDDDEDDDKQKKASEQMDAAIKTLQGENAVLKKQLADAQITDAALDARIAERLQIIDTAKPHLPQGFAVAGKAVVEIKRAVVGHALGDAAIKDWGDGQVDGAFATITRAKSTGAGLRGMTDAFTSAMGNTNGMLMHGNGSATLLDAENEAKAAHAEYVKTLQGAYKAPFGDTRN